MANYFSCIKIWSNRSYPSQNYCQSNLLFCFTDSYKCQFIWPFQFLAKFAKNTFVFTDIVSLHHHHIFILINTDNMRKKQLSSGDLGYANVSITINHLLKMYTRHFQYFHCFNFIMTFDKKFMKKVPFLTSSKFLICCKILHSGYRRQLNDYQKYPLNNSQNLQNILMSTFV